MVTVRFHFGHVRDIPKCVVCGASVLPGSSAQSNTQVHERCWVPPPQTQSSEDSTR